MKGEIRKELRRKGGDVLTITTTSDADGHDVAFLDDVVGANIVYRCNIRQRRQQRWTILWSRFKQ